MSNRVKALCAALAAAATIALPNVVSAMPVNYALAGKGAPANVENVRWRGGWGWRGGGWGWGAGGFAAGALIGSALARPYYGYGYYPYYPAYPAPAYYPPPAVYAGPPGDAVSYCMQRYHSYDPRSGTFLGYDGARHPCP